MKTRTGSYWLPSVTLLMQNSVICVDFALCARGLRDAKLCYKNANDSASLRRSAWRGTFGRFGGFLRSWNVPVSLSSLPSFNCLHVGFGFVVRY